MRFASIEGCPGQAIGDTRLPNVNTMLGVAAA